MSLNSSLIAGLREKLLVLTGVLIVMIPISPANMPLTYRDSGIFLYIGKRILEGIIPYRDVWDHKPPVIYYINAFGLYLIPASRWGVWLIEFLAVLVAAAVGFRLIKTIFGSTPAILSLVAWLTTLVFVIQGGNLATEYTLPLQFIALWLFYMTEVEPGSSWHWFFLGMVLTLAFLTKQTTIGIGLAVVLYITFRDSPAREWRRWGQKMLPLAAGCLPVFLLVGGYFYFQGALDSFWDAAFSYNFAYAFGGNGGFSERLEPIMNGVKPLSQTGLLPLSLLGYVAAGIFLRERIGAALFWSPLLAVALIDFPLELLLVSLSGRSYPHYYMTLLPVLAVFIGFFFWILESYLSSRGISLSGKRIFLVGVLVSLVWVSYGDYRNQLEAFARVNNREVIDFIQQKTDPEDLVLLWGAEASINFFSDRKSPGRFVYQYPLYHPDYASKRLIEEFLDDVIDLKPRLIIDTKNANTPIFEFPIADEEIASGIARIQSQYAPVGNLGHWTVYELILNKEDP